MLVEAAFKSTTTEMVIPSNRTFFKDMNLKHIHFYHLLLLTRILVWGYAVCFLFLLQI